MPIEGTFFLQGTLDDVCSHFQQSLWWWLGEGATVINWVEVRDAAKHATLHRSDLRTTSTYKADLVPKDYSVMVNTSQFRERLKAGERAHLICLQVKLTCLWAKEKNKSPRRIDLRLCRGHWGLSTPEEVNPPLLHTTSVFCTGVFCTGMF